MTLEQAFFTKRWQPTSRGNPIFGFLVAGKAWIGPNCCGIAKTQNLAGIFYVQCRDKLSQIPPCNPR